MKEITLALAKGRVAKQTLAILEEMSVKFSEFTEDTRKLVIWDDSKKVRLILVKAVDVPTYVETGAADIGIVGKDVIMEDAKDVYELLDLEISRCKIAVAGFPEEEMEKRSSIIVASKYPNIAKRYFESKGRQTDIIKLNGSIELAPLIGMSHVIVDIVETGNTLRENGLVVLEEIAESSARVIANKAGYATKTEEVQKMIQQLREGMAKINENRNS